MYVVCWGGGQLYGCHYWKMLGGSGCRSGVLIVGVIAAGVALGFGAVLNLHFLRKRRFLSVILPDPSTLTQYWWFGWTIMTFLVVFHRWFSELCMATVLPVCNEKLWVCLLYLSTILVFQWWRKSSSQCCAAAIHSGCGL